MTENVVFVATTVQVSRAYLDDIGVAPSTPKGDGCVENEEGRFPPTGSPCSPFATDGKCRSCGGFLEHFKTCPHATWEAREL